MAGKVCLEQVKMRDGICGDTGPHLERHSEGLGQFRCCYSLALGQESGARYFETLYRYYVRAILAAGTDIEDPDVIVAQLREAECEAMVLLNFSIGEGRQLHDELQEKILDAGYFGVPTYVVDGESYFGRQHLPRVRWHLGGRKGPILDIAYDSVMR